MAELGPEQQCDDVAVHLFDLEVFLGAFGVWGSHQLDAGYGRDTLAYVVELRLQPLDMECSSGEPLTIVAVYDAVSGDELAWGGLVWQANGPSELTELPTVASPGVVTRERATATRTEATTYEQQKHPGEATPRPPFGETPFTAVGLSPRVAATLQEYPLMPGGRWVYRIDVYTWRRWSGSVYTETVHTADAVAEDLIVADIDTVTQPLPGSRRVVGAPQGYSAGWRVVHGGDVYAADSIEALEALVELLSAPTRLPTVAPIPEYFSAEAQRGVPVPIICLPLSVGVERPYGPDPGLGWNWRTVRREQALTPAGAFEQCYREESHGHWQWFCPGTGFVRFESCQGGSWATQSQTVLISADLP